MQNTNNVLFVRKISLAFGLAAIANEPLALGK
jgi:hypothetical protein